MLSILIPTYNLSCFKLVKDLLSSCLNYKESISTHFDFEIIVADDASTDDKTILINKQINDLQNCIYYSQQKNCGRSAIRNFLASKANGNFLLFIDSDAKLVDISFVANYMCSITTYSVVCGGIKNVSYTKKLKYNLRYLYERNANDIRTLNFRRKYSYKYFSSFNFLISKDLFFSIKFDESINLYGHEDTLFGLVLQKKEVPILHIDNPLIHLGIDSNKEFILKTEQSLLMLKKLEMELHDVSSLIQLKEKLNKKKLLFLIKFWHYLFGFIERRLLSRYPSLCLFNLYKLGFYASL